MYVMHTVPWEHQLRALDFLMVRTYGALYTDMGSGKTKVGIDLIVNKGFQFTVIVGTKKSCDVWVKEFGKHCDMVRRKILLFNAGKYNTREKVSILKEKMRSAAISHQKLVLIINYESIWRKPFSEFLIKQHIDCVICDESHKIKSPSSKCSWYLMRLGKVVPNRILMTGTPTTESPLDVYAQYRFLQPSIFGTRFDDFRDRYENLNVRATMFAGYRVLDKKQPYKHLDELKEKMYSCAFYVTPDLKLPDQTFIDYTFTPSKKLIEIYKEVKKEGVYAEGDAVMETNNALAKILRQQQILSGYLPMETDNFTKQAKKVIDHTRAQALMELLEEIPKFEPVVVFAKFRHDFNQIKQVCNKLGYGYAEISGQRDDEQDWQQGKANVLAVHYVSGSESIDLTKARYCIYYSLSHSYGLYRQSLKRIHRPGQTRPVTYYNIVCKIPKIRTIDEQILTALQSKQDVAEYLLKNK